jgi:hypothetical protein
MITNTKRRRLGWLTVALFAMSALLMPATTVLATTEHCPEGGTKVEATGGTQAAINDLVLAAGTSFCVKGSTDATGILVANGTTTLKAYLGNDHDVSHYVVYETTTTTGTTTTGTTTTGTTTTGTTTTGTVSGTTTVNTTTDETTTGTVSGTTSVNTTTDSTGGTVSGTTSVKTLPETSMVEPTSPVNSGMISLAFLLLGVGSLMFLVLTPAQARKRD